MSATVGSLMVLSVGATLGAWLRWGLSAWLNPLLSRFPLGTFSANMLGGLLVGFAVAWFADHPWVSPLWRMLAITGFLGGLTTFSTFSAEVVDLLMRGDWGSGFLLALAHLAGSLCMTALGFGFYRVVNA